MGYYMVSERRLFLEYYLIPLCAILPGGLFCCDRVELDPLLDVPWGEDGVVGRGFLRFQQEYVR